MRTEVILLVDDEDMIRTLVRRFLENQGYTVLDACDGRAGLAVCEAHAGPIHLLLTDVQMPQLGGCQLAEGARKMRPTLKTLFMSGCGEDALQREGLSGDAPFLNKPFTSDTLVRKVRATLDSDARLALGAD